MTKDPKTVADCKPVGSVEGKPPFAGPKDARNQMLNQASVFGADTLLITSEALKATGIAYLCRQPKP